MYGYRMQVHKAGITDRQSGGEAELSNEALSCCFLLLDLRT
jgi:hypothetical protein